MADLTVTVADVRELADRLRFIAAEFEDSEDIADAYAEQMGHGDLAHEVEQFAANWKHKRRKLMENLQSFADEARLAADTFTGVEDDLAGALEGE
ncbi:type VII secretion target [Streptomyces litchfieldiae]|uniref:Type VII secretion target n=1 Tax=Streptomyces litchfieldiae TaxID=3075543 RepID=A0ABU2MWC8_9ACTN|nr:type VII secretion target [Streptomyces sp. DSM 44938]MDT0345947.1 type VII secretion target [Streptomyces sp. DSM 44938]